MFDLEKHVDVYDVNLGVKIHVEGVKVHVGVKLCIGGVKFLESVNFLEI